jgi:hypothetical protein
MVPFGATTKSPLNSGFRHTTIRTESPGDSTDCSLEARDAWADAETEKETSARRVRKTWVRINLGSGRKLVMCPTHQRDSRATLAQSMPR